jgi:DNA-directed RNA polymerase delta subunit
MNSDREQQFSNIIGELFDIYKKKNKDYGNSFTDLYQKFGLTSSVIRLSDKLNRLENLCKTETIEVKDESINDTLMDLANYAILTLIERGHGNRSWIDKELQSQTK